MYNINIQRVRPCVKYTYHYRLAHLCYRTYKHQPITKLPKTKALEATNGIVEASYYIGKGIILFTMFYTGLNYFYYKSLRDDAQNQHDKKNEKNDDKR